MSPSRCVPVDSDADQAPDDEVQEDDDVMDILFHLITFLFLGWSVVY